MRRERTIDAETQNDLARILDRQRDERLELLREFVRLRSVTGEELDIQRHVERVLREGGLETWRQDVDHARIAEHLPGMHDTSFANRPNVIGVLRGTGGGRSIVLNAHVDTVVAGDESRWTHPPFSATLAEGAIWGRGACDMKAGLVACLYAVRALRDTGARLRGDVIVAATVAEESGGAGSVAYALAGPKAHAAIVTEPTGLSIAPAHAGSAQLRVTINGRSAHACVRHRGVSSIEKFVSLFRFLREYERERCSEARHPLFAEIDNPVPVNVGVVRGGASATIVPEETAVDVRIGMMPGEDFATVRADLEARLAVWAREDAWLAENPPSIEWVGVRFPASEIPPDHELVKVATDAFRAATGRSAMIKGMTYGTDMTHFVRLARIPTLLFGPGDMEYAHRADERVPVDDLHTATDVLAATVAAWCA